MTTRTQTASTPPAVAAPHEHRFHPSIIREYDMRGIVGETLHAADAYATGRVFAAMAREQAGRPQPVITLGRDGRLSSPELAQAMAGGLRDGGADVVCIGTGPTPMLYFSVYHLAADAGVMVTGSHNPPGHNGFKLMLGTAPFYGEQIRELARRAAAGEWKAGEGTIREEDVRDAYMQAMLEAVRIHPPQPLKVVWDAGNGAAGEITRRLADALRAAHCMSSVLYADIDGTFPHHHPDPSVPENLRDLQEAVQAQGAQLGLAFDGDGDRLGAVDDKGRLIAADHLLILLARHVLEGSPGADIIADVKSGQTVFEAVEAAGGRAQMWKTGHSHIKTRLKACGAAFAGEASGHLFFADRYYGFDDGLYAALRLIELTSGLNRPLSALIDELPVTHSTPECRIELPEERKFTVIDEIRTRLDAQGVDYLAIDGVRVMTPQGWWLIRASNTQAAIIARAESATPEGLAALRAMLRTQLEASGVQNDSF